MGGMQVLEWASTYPEIGVRLPCRSRPRRIHSAQNIAFHEVGRQAIYADPAYAGRPLLGNGLQIPARGLAVARMAAHITYHVVRRR